MPKTERVNREFDNFDRTMQELIKIPHSEIKAKLDAEKAARNARPKTKRSSKPEGGGKQ